MAYDILAKGTTLRVKKLFLLAVVSWNQASCKILPTFRLKIAETTVSCGFTWNHTPGDECAYCCKIRAQGMARQLKGAFVSPERGKNWSQLRRAWSREGGYWIFLSFAVMLLLMTLSTIIFNNFLIWRSQKVGSYPDIDTLKKKQSCFHHNSHNFESIAWVPTMAQKEPIRGRLTYFAPWFNDLGIYLRLFSITSCVQ